MYDKHISGVSADTGTMPVEHNAQEETRTGQQWTNTEQLTKECDVKIWRGQVWECFVFLS